MLRSVMQGVSRLRLCAARLPGAQGCGRPGAHLQPLPLAIPTLQQVRTTYILKRKTKPHLEKETKRGRRQLKARHFVYDLVEDVKVKKQEPVKVILTTAVEGFGTRGQVVEVKPNKARHHLLLPGLAVYASPENLEKYANLVNVEDEDQPSSQFARRTAEQLSLQVVSCCMNLHNPWQLEPWHVRVAFRKGQMIVPEEALTLPHHPITGPDLSLEGKEFIVRVKINKKEEAPVRCKIHHIASNPLESLPWVANHWRYAGEALFPEEAELLKELAAKNPHTITQQLSEEEEEF